jgi:hypothetical protein
VHGDCAATAEEVAGEFLRRLRLTRPMHPFGPVKALGLRICEVDGPSGLHGKTVYVTKTLAGRELAFVLAHEVGHYLARCWGCDSEDTADCIGAAVLMPRARFEADLSGLHWDIEKMWRRYRYCSRRAIGVRLTMVLATGTSAVATPKNNNKSNQRVVKA